MYLTGRQAQSQGGGARWYAGRTVAQGARALDGITGGVDLLGICIRDLDRKLVLEGHDDLDGVQAVQTEVVDEVRRG